jgi:hypothetical protein
MQMLEGILELPAPVDGDGAVMMVISSCPILPHHIAKHLEASLYRQKIGHSIDNLLKLCQVTRISIIFPIRIAYIIV